MTMLLAGIVQMYFSSFFTNPASPTPSACTFVVEWSRREYVGTAVAIGARVSGLCDLRISSKPCEPSHPIGAAEKIQAM